MRTVACKIKMLSVKYIYKKQLIKKMDVIKKKPYHLLLIQNERNGAASMHGNGILNTSSDFLHQTMTATWNEWTSRTKCSPPIQLLRCMAIWNPLKSPRHSNLEALFLLHIFWFFFCALYQKSCNLYGTN